MSSGRGNYPASSITGIRGRLRSPPGTEWSQRDKEDLTPLRGRGGHHPALFLRNRCGDGVTPATRRYAARRSLYAPPLRY
ncbi:hypothetical protein Pr1d_33010 [Bythopirellula goksoeyrii]|uniref:Uncharacterized protein n=1 Tax=Bythopirellula goksoeyrii TaxID=1400387 RepID=A0A5B9QER8_9BACT|nr:hypothetical protein Pr1d_33010 [Bythopirellula goksoeyrii]